MFRNALKLFQLLMGIQSKRQGQVLFKKRLVKQSADVSAPSNPLYRTTYRMLYYVTMYTDVIE